jgi:hypothetical protein
MRCKWRLAGRRSVARGGDNIAAAHAGERHVAVLRDACRLERIAEKCAANTSELSGDTFAPSSFSRRGRGRNLHRSRVGQPQLPPATLWGNVSNQRSQMWSRFVGASRLSIALRISRSGFTR